MYKCSNCGKEYSKWQGKCDACHEWGTIQEEVGRAEPAVRSRGKKESKVTRKVTKFELKEGNFESIQTGIGELDNSLGGRMIRGQVILLSGSPGIGKSTLSSQLADKLSTRNYNVTYICGEESPEQIHQRLKRLKLKAENVDFIQEYEINHISAYIEDNKANIDVLIVDSIQTVYSANLTSMQGSVSQVSECTSMLTTMSKAYGITTIIIGHVTKSGEIAGPKLLEHIVDTVMYFEGDKTSDLRILKVEKNRFGPTDEVGLFQMTESGLKELNDTKDLFSKDKPENEGSVYSMVLEGNRAFVIEVQALATKTYFSNPRRATSGFDLNRLYILLAVIDKNLRLATGEFDIYVNITGGLKTSDRGLDLAIIKAIVSSIRNLKVKNDSVTFGEVGLTGEIRKVHLQEKREKEAKRMGFSNVETMKTVKKLSELI
jgi:DNA repair protein RadA/Sms